MKIIKITMELGIDDSTCGETHEDIANYLTRMLYTDPEFFGEFGQENILSVGEWE
jgi:hypothetical protein